MTKTPKTEIKAAAGPDKTPAQTSKNTNGPAYHIYAVIPSGRNGTKIGNRIGAVFNHKVGDGMTGLLDAQPLPVGGRIEFLMFPPRNDQS